ncbi:MAG: succinate dehydrogenase, cytochrome b556 subunit [Rhodospirillales bacterium]|nr:succinate dehydrogenase, cytochrome b556 subunit [Rhodospirillales bacterium]
MADNNRPLSPHLQVYRPQITSILSITHRATGVALAVGTLFFTYWLLSATYGAEKFASAQALFGSFVGQVVLWGFTFSIFFHLANGLRHLAWDIGWGFELDKLRTTGLLVILFAAGMTILTLVIAYSAAGGAS